MEGLFWKTVNHAIFFGCIFATIGLSVYSISRFFQNEDITLVQSSTYHSSEERRALRSSSSSTGRWLKENGTRNSPPRYKITSQQIYEKHPRPRLELFQKLVNVSWFVKIFLREHFSSNKLRRNPFNSGDGTAVDSPLHLAAEKQNTHTDYCASTDFHRHKPARSSSLEGRRFGK